MEDRGIGENEFESTAAPENIKEYLEKKLENLISGEPHLLFQ
jgi:hypothetical protein